MRVQPSSWTGAGAQPPADWSSLSKSPPHDANSSGEHLLLTPQPHSLMNKFAMNRHNPPPLIVSLLACAGLLGSPALVSGQTFTWNSTTNNAPWTTPSNWTPAGPANAAGVTANFTNNIPNDRSFLVDAPVTVGIINIGDPAGNSSFTLTSSGNATNTITLDNGASAAQMNFLATSTGTDSVTASLRFAGNLSISNMSGASKNIAAGTHSSASAGNKVISNVGTGNGTLNFTSGAIFANGSGSVSIVQNSATSAISIGNTANLYSGGFTLQQGTVQIAGGANTAFGNGTLTLAGGTFEKTAGADRTITNAVSITGDISFVAPAGESIIFQTAATDLNGATRNLSVTGGVASFISSANITNGGITKSGNGTLSFAGTKGYTGATTINAGTLLLTSTGNISSTQLGFSVADATSGVLEIQNTAFAFSGSLQLNLAGVTVSNNTWNLFTGSAFGPTDLTISGVGSNFGAFTFGNGTWNITDGGGRDWKFSATSGQLSVIPEPSTWALIAIGLCALTIFRRRRIA